MNPSERVIKNGVRVPRGWLDNPATKGMTFAEELAWLRTYLASETDKPQTTNEDEKPES